MNSSFRCSVADDLSASTVPYRQHRCIVVRNFLVGNSRKAVCRQHTDALYQVHYVGRVEYEQYRAEYTALWHAELDGRRC